MLPARLAQRMIRSLDWLVSRYCAPDPRPMHQQTGARGEEYAYFHLRKLGYVIVARNFKPAEAAVDHHKRRELAEVAREYRRLVSPLCQWRIDIVSVYYDRPAARPQIEVFQNVSLGG
jgi:Holliday junction resolvase-like predicted endonuclease